MTNLAALLRDRGNYAAAEPLYREAISILEEMLPPGYPMTANSKAGLGLVLVRSIKDPALSEGLRDKRLEEAESLLLGAEKELFVTASPTSLKKRVLESLIELYELRDAITPGQGYGEKATQKREQSEAFKKN